MNIFVIYLGEPKEKYLRDALSEYEKRISAFGKLTNIGLKPVSLPDNPSEKEIVSALEKEADGILLQLNKLQGSKKIALCVEGRQLSSEQLSDYLDRAAVDGCSSVAFVIGSSFGLSERVKARCDLRLSFSAMTFPHQLMRVILEEQIYRAFSISSGSKYHK